MALAAGALVAAMLPGVALAQDDATDTAEDVSLLYVVSSNTGSVDGTTLTLNAVPSVIWFTDRPARGAGHIAPSELVELWAEGEDSFADDPPNAVVSLLDEDTVADAVIELTDITAEGDNLAFTYELLDGELPVGPIATASLFIDSITTQSHIPETFIYVYNFASPAS
jgi:hypothetical protein